MGTKEQVHFCNSSDSKKRRKKFNKIETVEIKTKRKVQRVSQGCAKEDVSALGGVQRLSNIDKWLQETTNYILKEEKERVPQG